MVFNPSDFLYHIKTIITGTNGFLRGTSGAKSYDGGIKHEVDIPLSTVSSGAAALVVTTGATNTTPYGFATAAQANALVTAVNKLLLGADANAIPAINVATGTTAIGTVDYIIPRDYDEASDSFMIRVQIAVNATDVAVPIKLTGAMSWYNASSNTLNTLSAVTATLPFTTTQNLGSTQTTYEINLGSNSLKRDDVVSVVLALSGTTAAGPAYVYGVEVLYDSTIVSYNITDQSGIDGVLSEYGNPLR